MVDKSLYGTISGATYGTYSEYSEVTDGFFEKRAKGEFLPNHLYSFYRLDHKCPFSDTYNGSRNEVGSRGIRTFHHAYTSGTYETPPAQDRFRKIDGRSIMHQVCANKLVSRARNIEIDLGVALGEYSETAEFIASTLKKSVEMMRSLRKGNLSDALRIYNTSSHKTLRGTGKVPYRSRPDVRAVLDASADTQLMTSFALRPLINDVFDAINVLNNGLENPQGLVTTVRASHKSNDKFEDKKTVGVITYGSSFDYEVSVSGKIRYVSENPIFSTFESLGLSNPLSVAWELVPLSFVLDWFIPVGAYIENVFPPKGLKFIDGYTYSKARASTYQYTDIPGWYTTYNGEEQFKDRHPLYSFPRYKLIIPDLSLSKKQVADGLSLMWNFFS